MTEIYLGVATCLHQPPLLMVSSSLGQLLERARLRFGVEVEILDSRLQSVYPEGESDLSRSIGELPAVRGALLEALSGGRPQRLESAGHHYRIFPLSRSARRRQPGSVMAIRRTASGAAGTLDAEAWSDLARAMVEADYAAVDSLNDEQQASRRLAGAMRFVEFLMDAADEATVAHALVHAAAVWYDVDARVYQRGVRDEFALHTCLPAVQPTSRTLALGPTVSLDRADLYRIDSPLDAGVPATGHHSVLLPLTSVGRADWLLLLAGPVPNDADVVLRMIGRAAGAQLASFAAQHAVEARGRFEAVLGEPTRAPELAAMRAVHVLAQSVGADAASLTLRRNGQERRIAVLGPATATKAIADAEGRSDRLARELALGQSAAATLEVVSAPGTDFTPASVIVLDACADVLRTWLAGALSSFDVPQTLSFTPTADVPGFVARIQEELERARRFDLRLSLILIDVHAPSDAMPQLQEVLRRELRGSDVTGTMGGTQLAALLTHTDSIGLDNVVRRVRQRLVDTAERLNVSGVRLGQAAFSPEVRTADALLDLALQQAEPLIVH
jgi:hypothetical protein